MKNSIKMISCTLAGLMVGGATIVCANQAIQAMQNTEIKVSLNGQVQEFKDETTGERQYPITYNNRTYLPLRNVAQLSGLDVDYDNEKNEAKLSDRTSKTENVGSVTVVDAVNYTDGYYNLFKVRLPKIIGNTSAINELNNQILNEVLPRTYADAVCHAETDGTAMDKGSMYDYKYIIKNDILIIYIFSSVPEGGSLIPASGGGLQKYSYFYDIKNDKVLKISQAAKALNMSLDNVVSYNGDKIDSYDKLDNNEFVVVIDKEDIKLVSEL